MEQRRVYGKSQWYHETQARNQNADVLPLVPEAAHVADRFLLDLALPDAAQQACAAWLHVSSQIAHHLFPDAVTVTRLNTFSAYERFSTALTVAQVFGVQRLCNHYAARLAPLPGPDSSRESNYRLAQITQYARQLAASPSVICTQSRQQLDAVGLSTPDIVLITQIVGFVGYQARVIAAGQALLGLPVRWIPGMPVQEEASSELFRARQVEWQAGLEGVESQDPSPSALNALLAWDPTLLRLETKLIESLVCEDEPSSLIALVSARINGSPACFARTVVSAELAECTRAGERELLLWSQQKPQTHALVQATLLLTKAPDRFSAAHFAPLVEQGFSDPQVLTLLAWCGLSGWLNRLKIALGEALPVA